MGEINEVAEAIKDVAVALRVLGLNDAATSMGALELLSKEIKEGSERIAEGLNSIASAIMESEYGG